MILRRLKLSDYRNYTALDVTLGGGVNIFAGENAQGKTNLLEAVYLTGIGRSMRTKRDRELIRRGAEGAKVTAFVESAAGKSRIEITIGKTGAKSVTINGAQTHRLGELMGVFTTVMFSPDEIAVIKAAPDERRRFIDITISQISRPYFYLLVRYNRTLAQRNRLLKAGAGDDELDVWDAQLAAAGAKIIRTRRGFVKRMAGPTREEHAFLTSGKEELSLAYESIEGDTEDEIRAAFVAELLRTRESDRRLGFTHAGAQTDDLAVTVGDVDIRKFGSQGQQRTAALSLKLASMRLLYEETGEYPVLLLDDVFSELDEARRARLIERISVGQTIITATDIDAAGSGLTSAAALFKVCAGRVTALTKA